MKKFSIAFLLLNVFIGTAQEVQKDTIVESLKETVDGHSMKFTGLDERLSEMSSDLSGLKKISVSGYIQAQYDSYDYDTQPTVTNTFSIRRARVKFAYKAADGVKFVVQPDFAIDKVSMKDAYVVLNDRWTNTFALTMGQFDRPSYEVEYSSGSMESLERSKLSAVLYPGEKEVGAKLEANFETKYNLPLKLQLAVVNGNFGTGAIANQVKDIDSQKDIMTRATYSLKLPSSGLGIDFGGHGYFGHTTVLADDTFTDVNNVAFAAKKGDLLKKQWLGAEMQIYYDFLGGVSLKGEYISGTISGSTNAAQANKDFAYNAVKEFKGFYTQLIKNIGKSNQAVLKFDMFDPNKNISGNEVSNKSDLKYSAWSFSWQYFFDENVKIVAGYSIPKHESTTNIADAGKKNTFTLRLQAKF
ncbi:MAG: porin [Flavobacterium sp.]|uniref:porin n=1 Tax=Flavobacterium sp. TaxID=239 RepID=UPI0026179F2B|nr:porin [Flavobacterium sp.]MDD5150555.1 porin [Flavobacterium sp.]